MEENEQDCLSKEDAKSDVIMEENNLDSLSIKQAKEYAKKTAIFLADRWKHRRRMAYISLLAILVVTYWCVFTVPKDRLEVLDPIITWFYIIMGSIIGAYVGFATLDDKWKNK